MKDHSMLTINGTGEVWINFHMQRLFTDVVWETKVRCDRFEQCLLPFLQIACCTEISPVMHISKGLIGWSCIVTHFQLCTQTIFAVPKAVLSKAADSYMTGNVFLKKWWGRTQTTQEESSYSANAVLILYWSSTISVLHTNACTWWDW